MTDQVSADAGVTPPANQTLVTGADTQASGDQVKAEGAKTDGEGKLTAEEQTAVDAKATADAEAAAKLEAEGKNPDGTDTEGDKPVVPETYEFVLPEGMQIDTALADKFSAIAKARNMTQEDANQFVALAVEMRQNDAAQHLEKVTQWAESVKADKELGGDKLPATLANCSKVMSTFGTPELKAELDASGYGNNPHFIRLISKIGAALSEDTFVRGGSTTTDGTTREERMFPTTVKK